MDAIYKYIAEILQAPDTALNNTTALRMALNR